MDYNEYRGVRGLVYAEITQDTSEGYAAGKWNRLSGAQGITDTPSESSEAHYYDNMAAVVVDSEGADEVAMVISAPNNKTKAVLDGVSYNEAKDAIINTPKKRKYYAIGYIGEKTDGTEEAVIHYKGKFSGGAVTRNTKDDGTEATNLEYTFTGVHTVAAIATIDTKKSSAKKFTVPLTETLTEEDIFGAFTGDVSAGDVLTPDEILALT